VIQYALPLAQSLLTVGIIYCGWRVYRAQRIPRLVRYLTVEWSMRYPNEALEVQRRIIGMQWRTLAAALKILMYKMEHQRRRRLTAAEWRADFYEAMQIVQREPRNISLRDAATRSHEIKV
jgi:hypothetical protein